MISSTFSPAALRLQLAQKVSQLSVSSPSARCQAKTSWCHCGPDAQAIKRQRLRRLLTGRRRPLASCATAGGAQLVNQWRPVAGGGGRSSAPGVRSAVDAGASGEALPQHAHVTVRQFALHAAQAHTEGAPALNLGVDIAASAGRRNHRQVERDAAAALADETRPAQRHFAPPSQLRRRLPLRLNAGSDAPTLSVLFDAVDCLAALRPPRSARHDPSRSLTECYTDVSQRFDKITLHPLSE